MPIINSVAAMQDEVAGWRRDMHENPEILYNAGYSYEALHKRDLALAWIAKALEHKYAMAAVKHSPDMKGLISDSRFAALDKKFGG